MYKISTECEILHLKRVIQSCWTLLCPVLCSVPAWSHTLRIQSGTSQPLVVSMVHSPFLHSLLPGWVDAVPEFQLLVDRQEFDLERSFWGPMLLCGRKEPLQCLLVQGQCFLCWGIDQFCWLWELEAIQRSNIFGNIHPHVPIPCFRSKVFPSKGPEVGL